MPCARRRRESRARGFSPSLPVDAAAVARRVRRWRCSGIARPCCPTACPDWLELILTAPVVLWAGWPFFQRWAQSIAKRSPNMWTLIGTGVGAAFGYSVVATVAPGLFPASFREHGRVAVYFEAAAIIVSLTLLGQILELTRTLGHVGGAQGAARPGAEDRAAAAARRRRGGRSARARARRRPPARAARRESAGGRRGPRGPLERRRVDADGRADAGRKEAWRPAWSARRMNGTGRAGHARREGRLGHGARADRATGRAGAALACADAAARRQGQLLVRAGGARQRAGHLPGVGILRARACVDLRGGQRRGRADHRVSLCARPRHADVDHGGQRPRGAGRRAVP